MEIQEDKLQQRILKLRKKKITSVTAKQTPQKRQNHDADEEASVVFAGSPQIMQTFASPLKCTHNSRQYLEKNYSASASKNQGKQSAYME